MPAPLDIRKFPSTTLLLTFMPNEAVFVLAIYSKRPAWGSSPTF